MNVIKRDGTVVPFDLTKWQAQIAKVCTGVSDVSPSMIEIAAQAHFRDNMTTRELDNMALRAMIDLIDEEENPDTGNVNYQYVAGKQRISMLRKDVFGQYQVPRLYDIVKKNVNLGFYTDELLTWYTEEEWDAIDKFVDHDKDELFPYAAVDQLIEKYLVQNRVQGGEVLETPQIRYAVAAATIMHAEKKDRMRWVKDFYNCASDGMFTMATPVLAGLGTPTKQFSSCVLIKSDDTLKSIFASGQIMADYASKRAGIGLDVGRLRPLGAPIRGGEIKHTGYIPFLKKWFADLRSCCLTPNTFVEILAQEGSKKIRLNALKKGMHIKTLQDGNIAFKEVTAVMETVVPVEDQRVLTFCNGAVLHCSNNHPMMITEEEQILPDDISSQQIISDTGSSVLVLRSPDVQNTTYIDITVADTHTFFASTTEDGPMMLTHNSQGGIRNASATVNFPFWHYQIDDLIVLKNNQGTEETRVRHMDYSVVVNAFMWRRFKNKGTLTFFDPNEVPEMYEAFYRNTAEFERLYVINEARTDLRTKKIEAESFVKDMFIKERTDTGRYYILNIDNVMNQGTFNPEIHPVYQSNLCMEIVLPTESFQTINDAGELVIDYKGQELRISNLASARLTNGSIKLVRFISADDDVQAFIFEDGKELVL